MMFHQIFIALCATGLFYGGWGLLSFAFKQFKKRGSDDTEYHGL